MFFKLDVLKNFPKFTGKHMYRSLFFNDVVGIQSLTLFKIELRHRHFPVNFAKSLRTTTIPEKLIGQGKEIKLNWKEL